ncbi:16S rRNA (cytosine(1402)-N(4))-methyltransferase RsmH [Halieaceae bacterium IMCC14734]|uniref:Ribosomal RNA small subunit methyltransferase H n=1 Tax=Candidatus Litorirhabdus singularis TaxID=2518993 RepID=A0ABT3TJL7_9GAMM|nr:16S rRNA (cytosine(1402)-N(4))-methyltransferase RsmH [Candidatus Litorirhabdus singularis]MCX2982410.1 16S rRNA (cytosine(1402)-N(4))-methyltransferase RsmH [Candidatus Litorirhabdus singularis]
MDGSHKTVLLSEATEALITRRDGYYVDGTFGRGGHSREILGQLEAGGHLLAVDKDLQAMEAAAELADSEPRFGFEHGSFVQLPQHLQQRQVAAVDGILLDLGVSSPQLDEGERGFSFQNSGPLDMRMDTSQGQTAAQWLATVAHGDLARVLRVYGEERYAGRIAGAILRAREEAPLETTGQLAKVVTEANPRWEQHKHPATRAFQGIRIHINGELDELEQFLASSLELLVSGGRLVIISFHSLEDRIVKRFFRDMSRGRYVPAGVPIRDGDLDRQLRLVGKAVRAGAAEVDMNPRARSAIMRVAEKIGA